MIEHATAVKGRTLATIYESEIIRREYNHMYHEEENKAVPIFVVIWWRAWTGESPDTIINSERSGAFDSYEAAVEWIETNV